MPGPDPGRATGSLAGLMWTMVVAGLGIWAAVLRVHDQPPARWGVTAVLALCFVVTELTQLHVEVRRQALSLSLSEIPFVVGLFVVPPAQLLLCRLAGTLLVAVWRRMSPSKTLYNLLVVALEVALVVYVFQTVVGGGTAPDAGRPSAWVAAYAGLVAGTLLSGVLVASAIAQLQGQVDRQELVLLCAPVLVSAAFNTTVALVALIVVDAAPGAVVLLLLLLAGVAVAYRGYGELLRRHRSLAQLHDLAEAWARATASREIAAELLVHARPLLRAGHAELMLDGVHGRSALVLHEGLHAPAEADGVSTLLRDAYGSDAAVLVRRPLRGGLRVPVDSAALRDAAVVPLRHEGRVFGALMVANRLGETSTFGERDLALLDMIGTQAAVALQNGRLVERLTYEAHHDTLTGLPNRAAFLAHTDEALRDGGGLSVLLMDLDGFKEVNDTLGHSHGDELLKAVAERLVRSAPPGVFVARLGGDEFALLAPHALAGDGLAVAAELDGSLRAPFFVDAVHLDVRASIGVARFPQDGADSSTLLKRADIAMYEAKTRGSLISVYDASVDRSSHRRLALVGQLRSAIDAGALACHYQPKIDLRTGRVVGAEALVRWPHADLGLVAPDDFIPIAEQTGLIVPLTAYVLGQALDQARGWPPGPMGKAGAPGVAVNVSPRGLLAVGFVRSVLQALDESGVDPQRLTLEITENSVMADPATSVRVLTELHEVGVRLSVDDFGTGYSSLAYLQRLPVDEVKIDKSFVRDLGPHGERSAIVQAIVELGHTLGLQVVAEGVEDETAADQLRAMGCDLAQGYLYSRPVDGDAFRAWLAARPVPGPRLLPAARRA